MIDLHNHLLVGVDDGPKTDVEAVKLLKQAFNQGIADIIVTPHHYDSHFITPSHVVHEKLEDLKNIVASEYLNINIYPGHEVRINPHLMNELRSKDTMTLNGSRYILIEVSEYDIQHRLDNVIFDLQMRGFIPIMAHPERYSVLAGKEGALYHLVEKGVLVQITASAICGVHGTYLKKVVLQMIKNHIVHFVASDAHHFKSRPFMLKEAYQEINKTLGKEYVERLKKNAYSVLKDEEINIKAPRLERKNEKYRSRFLRYFKGK